MKDTIQILSISTNNNNNKRPKSNIEEIIRQTLRDSIQNNWLLQREIRDGDFMECEIELGSYSEIKK